MSICPFLKDEFTVITCYLRYTIDPAKVADFERFGQSWIRLVTKFGGVHHGYFLPSEGASNIAIALFTFPSLAEYEQYRISSFKDPECIEANEFAARSKCVLSYERNFLRPVFE